MRGSRVRVTQAAPPLKLVVGLLCALHITLPIPLPMFRFTGLGCLERRQIGYIQPAPSQNKKPTGVSRMKASIRKLVQCAAPSGALRLSPRKNIASAEKFIASLLLLTMPACDGVPRQCDANIKSFIKNAAHADLENKSTTSLSPETTRLFIGMEAIDIYRKLAICKFALYPRAGPAGDLAGLSLDKIHGVKSVQEPGGPGPLALVAIDLTLTSARGKVDSAVARVYTTGL